MFVHLGSFFTSGPSIYTELSSPCLTFPLLQVLVLFFLFFPTLIALLPLFAHLTAVVDKMMLHENTLDSF